MKEAIEVHNPHMTSSRSSRSTYRMKGCLNLLCWCFTTNRAHRLTLVPDEKPLVEIQKTAPTFLLTCLLDLIVENQSLTTGCQKAMLV